MKKLFGLQQAANITAFVWAGIFVDILNLSILNPFLPQIMFNMGANTAQVGLVFSINALLGLLSNLIWGSLADRIGRKPVLLICRAGTLLGFLVLMSANSILMIFIARIIDGLFSRMEPVGLTVISDLVPPERRSREMSRIGAAWIIGGLIGPVIGAFAANRGIFFIGMAHTLLMIFAIAITIFFIDETLPKEKQSEGQQNKSVSSALLNTLRLLKRPAPRSLIVQSLFSKLAYFSFMSTASIFMSLLLKLDISRIGALLTAINVANLIIRSLFFTRLLTRLGDGRMMRLGFSLYVLGFIWLGFASSVWEFFGISLLLSFATSSSADVIFGVISKTVRQDQVGGMIGINSGMESISLVIGPVLGSTLLVSANPSAYGIVFAVFSLFALITSIASKPIINTTETANQTD